MPAAPVPPADVRRQGEVFCRRWIAITALVPVLCVSSVAEAADPPVALVLVEVPATLGSTWESVLSGSAVAALEARGHRAGAVVMRAPAVDATGDARERVAAGIASYDALGYTAAVEQLSLAIAGASATGASGLSRAELGDAFLFRGLARRALGDSAAAFADFQQAAVLAPGRSLDPARFAPDVREAYERARVTIAEGKHGTLVVRGPAGAAVVVDATPAGVTPIRLEGVAHGGHFIRVEADGHLPWSTRLEMSAPVSVVNAVPVALPPAADLADPASVARLADGRGATVAVTISVARDADATYVTLREVDVGGRRVRTEAMSEAVADPTAAAAWIGRRIADFAPAHAAPAFPALPEPSRPGPVKRAVPWILTGAAAIVIGGVVTAVVLGTRGAGDAGFTAIVHGNN